MYRFSTDAVPRAERLPFWREAFGRSAVRAEVEPRSTDQFRARALMEVIPGLRVTSLVSTPASIARTPQLLDDGDDTVVLLTPQRGKLIVAQRGRDLVVRSGEAVLMLHSEPCFVAHNLVHLQGIVVPRPALAGVLPDLGASLMQAIPAEAPALRLLLHYVSGISAELAHTSDRVRTVVGSHVHDLMTALATQGAGLAPAGTADTAGVRAARLAVIKADIISQIGNAEVTVGHVAARHHTTPRTVQRLFEEEGSTFSTFKLEQQLVFARRLLAADRRVHPSIADIAYAAGFSDLSYFHRSFRRRFGITPAEYRRYAGSASQDGSDGPATAGRDPIA